MHLFTRPYFTPGMRSPIHCSIVPLFYLDCTYWSLHCKYFRTIMSCISLLANVVCFTCTTLNKALSYLILYFLILSYLILSYHSQHPIDMKTIVCKVNQRDWNGISLYTFTHGISFTKAGNYWEAPSSRVWRCGLWSSPSLPCNHLLLCKKRDPQRVM